MPIDFCPMPDSGGKSANIFQFAHGHVWAKFNSTIQFVELSLFKFISVRNDFS